DYYHFYTEKRYGFDRPLRYVHIHADGTLVYRAILYIPEKTPLDCYTKVYEKGLELYSSGVLIMEKCPDLLPDYFSFVKGMVDSEDSSLNMTRDMLQHDCQLIHIADRIRWLIKNEMLKMFRLDLKRLVKFFLSFGRQLKYGIYSYFG